MDAGLVMAGPRLDAGLVRLRPMYDAGLDRIRPRYDAGLVGRGFSLVGCRFTSLLRCPVVS